MNKLSLKEYIRPDLELSDGENNFYAANTIPFYYQHHPIEINTNELIRAYVVNILEFDAVNNFHLHGTLFHHYPAGTNTVPSRSASHRSAMSFSIATCSGSPSPSCCSCSCINSISSIRLMYFFCFFS